mgnify:CR=1 FL=1
MIKKYNLIFVFITLSLLISSCNTLKKAFDPERKNSSEEFLVEKKSPLSMPPKFDELPVPKSNEQINQDQTEDIEELIIEKNLSKKEKEEAVSPEKVHLDQMAQGKLQYDNNTVTWKKDTRSPARVYKRIDGKIVDAKTGKAAGEGDKNFEWEDEAYKNS